MQTFDVTDLLTDGDNVIGALLSDGWWRGQNSVARRVDDYGTTTALLAQLVVTLASGETVTFGTDESWRSTPSHILAADLIAGEVHDLRRRATGAALASWTPVRVEDHGYDGSSARRRRRRSVASRSSDRCRSRELGTGPVGRRRRPEHQRLGPAARPRAGRHRDHAHLRRVARRDGDVTQEHVYARSIQTDTDAAVPDRRGHLGRRRR